MATENGWLEDKKISSWGLGLRGDLWIFWGRVSTNYYPPSGRVVYMDVEQEKASWIPGPVSQYKTAEINSHYQVIQSDLLIPWLEVT